VQNDQTNREENYHLRSKRRGNAA